MKLFEKLAWFIAGDPFNRADQTAQEIDMIIYMHHCELHAIARKWVIAEVWNSYQTHGNGD